MFQWNCFPNLEMARSVSLIRDCVVMLLIRATLLTSTDPFAEADEDTGETKQSQNYIHIRIQRTFDPLQSIFAVVVETRTIC